MRWIPLTTQKDYTKKNLTTAILTHTTLLFNACFTTTFAILYVYVVKIEFTTRKTTTTITGTTQKKSRDAPAIRKAHCLFTFFWEKKTRAAQKVHDSTHNRIGSHYRVEKRRQKLSRALTDIIKITVNNICRYKKKTTTKSFQSNYTKNAVDGIPFFQPFNWKLAM